MDFEQVVAGVRAGRIARVTLEPGSYEDYRWVETDFYHQFEYRRGGEGAEPSGAIWMQSLFPMDAPCFRRHYAAHSWELFDEEQVPCMPVGEHEGVPLSEIDTQYLRGQLELYNPTGVPKMTAEIEAELKRRGVQEG